MRSFLRELFSRADTTASAIDQIHRRRDEFAKLDAGGLKAAAIRSRDPVDVIAAAVVIARHLLDLDMFDVQIQGALALANGRVAEMQTGEGKTLAAVPAIVWYAKAKNGVHVMTVNDYLARRDGHWMGGIYEFFGLTAGCIQQDMPPGQRRNVYSGDITYSTANEIGFDFLRDGLALYPADPVHRPFAVAVIDEADSILIDEARIPLVIAGGEDREEPLAVRVDQLTRRFFRGAHYAVDEHGRNVFLTDRGIQAVEHAFGRENLFAEDNLPLLTAVEDSLRAHALLRRDVDYLVKDGAIESVDEFKGRIAINRRWPAGLHTAIEAKEGVGLKKQGAILGSITVQNLIALYPKVCGMTGTASTQADEFRTVYGLDVEVIPTNRPVIRIDRPDAIFRTKRDKVQSVVEEIRAVHETGRPVLVGTASVEESEQLSAFLRGIPHTVLNARHDEREAAIVARAGERDAVTISTNMAGRGTDIRLGEGVAEAGGLHVIGTNKHESRRIDNQLRGRAGRQGDPGSSRFFISLEDDLLVKYGINNPKFGHDPDSLQRMVEGQNLDIRRFLQKYESVVEGQRQQIQDRRQQILCGAERPELERLVSLRTIDDLWSEYLAAVTELRTGVHWVSWGGRDPLHEYLTRVDAMFRELDEKIDLEIARRLAEAEAGGLDPTERGSTWTYLTTDNPFGTWTERITRGLVRKLRNRDA